LDKGLRDALEVVARGRSSGIIIVHNASRKVWCARGPDPITSVRLARSTVGVCRSAPATQTGDRQEAREQAETERDPDQGGIDVQVRGPHRSDAQHRQHPRARCLLDGRTKA
jgi:hypothetical protein